uniref:Putative ribonuclease H-like domain-containing protein n=1 Tax=Tanacetum cinerariifolium TaxID=118510 RepID=A0A6L2L7G5_TANCI|nr:putative ribonuclease H-like domain-containing protein [Tanacetum cinerariifolium]
MNDRMMQSKEGKVDLSKALNARLKSNKDPRAEVQLTVEHNVHANEQHHSMQSETIYDTYLLEKVDSNITHDSTNMSHRKREIDQNAKKMNSQEESYGSNDMAYNHYLEEDGKKIQKRNRNSKSSVKHTTSLQNTTNGSKQKPRSNNQTSRSLHVSKSSCGMSNGVPLVDHSRNSSSFSDSKHFVCLTCQKCIFNANHDACLTKFLKDVNSRIKVLSFKTRNNIKPVEKKNNVIKLKRWISKGYRISPNKSSTVHEKPNTPRSCLGWKPMGRIFKTVGHTWIPTGRMFIDSTTVVDNKPLNGSNEDITNPYECEQTLNVSSGTLNLSAGTSFNPKEIYEAKVKSSSSTSHSTQNIAFVSSQNNDITNKSVSVVPSVFAASTKPPASILPNVDNLSDVVIYSFFARANGTTSIGFDMSKWNVITAIEEVILQGSASHLGTPREKTLKEELFQWILLLPMLYCHNVMVLVAMIKAFRIMKNQQIMPSWHLPPQPHQVLIMSSESYVSVPTSPVHDRYKSDEGYHAVPPHYTGTFMPLKPDLVFHDAPTASETVPNVFNVEPSNTKPNKEMSQSNRPSAPIIKDWVSDSEDESEDEPMLTQKAPSFVQTFEHVKTPRTSVKPVEHPKQAEHLRKDILKSRGHKHSWNRKACFVCKSVNHFIKDYDYYKKNMVQKPVWNHAMRVNHQNSARTTHPHSNKHVVPTTVLTRFRLVLLNAARLVTTVIPQTNAKHQRPAKHVVNKPHSPIRRPINHRPTPKNSNFYQKVITVKAKKVNAVKGTTGNWGNPQPALKDKGVIDSGCSRHMTGNISYLSEFKEINGGYVAFGENPKGGKIIGKGKIKTDKLDFDDVYFIKELKFNLFSVSQICDKKNSVLFTGTECVVLSFDFKLFDENHVLLMVLMENNMYNVDLKNIVPSRNLTCLFANATLDESNLWHRRLGHINFKTMNKLVKGNLVRGLPSKVLENNHTCVACKKGKQHKASYKTKPFSSVSQPLQRTPSIGFMRPFRCPVTILNTLDPLGKFDGNADEGFLVGYSVNRKAFKSMNYQLVVAGNQPTYNAGIQGNIDTSKVVKEAESVQQYVLLSLCDKPKKHDEKAKREAKGKSLVDLSTGVRDLKDEFKEFSVNSTNGVNAASTPVTAVGPNSTNSTNRVNATGPSDNAVSPNFEIGGKSSFVDLSQYPDNPDMPALEDIIYLDDEEDVAPQTRSMTRMVKEQVLQALKDPSWIEAMQEELLQFKMQKVWVLVDLPKGKRDIGSKWVFRNKKDERGIVIRNKARLVAQGHTKEEGIDYEEVFALVARIEAIRLFLAYASFMGFMVYQMDVKSAFLYRTIKEEVYVCQPPGFEDPDYPDKNDFQRGKIDHNLFTKKKKGDILLVQVYVDDIIFSSTNQELCKAFEKLMKDKFQMSSMEEITFFLGLQVKQKDNRIFISQDKYVAEILKKFGLTYGKPASTPIDIEKPLLKDPDGEDVDVHIYSDYAGASLDKKSTTGGCQFLGCRLISWQCKKQTVVATSSTEAKYVAAASGCAQILWIQNQLMDYGLRKTVSSYWNGICMSQMFQVLVQHHTSNGYQFTMSNPHQELTSPKQMALGKD